MSDVTQLSKDSFGMKELIAARANLLRGSARDYDPLMRLVGDANFVLLGEASHGTREFYRERALISQRLILEKGFNAIAVEADWPDAYRVNQYVRGTSALPMTVADTSARQALEGFQRFPSWMWRNKEVEKFVEWLRGHNVSQDFESRRVGFYGLDLYSLFKSIEEVSLYLDVIDKEEGRRARARYSCFNHFNQDSRYYAQVVGFGMSTSCETVVVEQLRALYALADRYRKVGDTLALEAMFSAQQNARLVVNAEEYYRTMYQGHVSSWNMRDQYMTETLGAISKHLSQTNGEPAKIVVWAHNSHIGDARGTEMTRRGEWNIGQLARELYGDKAVLIGMTTYQGSVTASSDWDVPAETKQVIPALDGSYEAAFHEANIGDFMLNFKHDHMLSRALMPHRLERAIGVIYRPSTERFSHYFYSSMSRQFDAVLHFDQSQNVEALELEKFGEVSEAPETFPVGI